MTWTNLIDLVRQVKGLLPTANGGVPAGGTTGQILTKASNSDNDVDWEDAASGSIVSVIGITVDGGAASPSTGSKGFIEAPFAGTITEWRLVANASGSAQFTVKKGTPSGDTNMPSTSSIVASAQPALSSQQRKRSTTLTSWTTTFADKDVFEFNLDSVTTCTRLTLELVIQRS